MLSKCLILKTGTLSSFRSDDFPFDFPISLMLHARNYGCVTLSHALSTVIFKWNPFHLLMILTKCDLKTMKKTTISEFIFTASIKWIRLTLVILSNDKSLVKTLSVYWMHIHLFNCRAIRLLHFKWRASILWVKMQCIKRLNRRWVSPFRREWKNVSAQETEMSAIWRRRWVPIET